MRTLLKLFFVPYLQFMAKLHLVVIPVVGMICLLRIEELMLLLPGLYPFTLYACSNRHQFKDNISWMLATFNKRTLITYHIVSQTLVSILLVALSALGVVATTILTIMVFPASSDSSTKVGTEQLLAEVRSGVDWVSTKEQLIFVMVGLFFLTTLYSPVSLKESLRQFDEDMRGQKKKLQLGAVFLFSMIFTLEFAEIGVRQFILPLLCSAIVGQLLYLVMIYNRAFALFNPRHYRRVLPGAAVLAVLFGLGCYQLALGRFEHSKNADHRVAELNFLGHFAPELSEAAFTDLVKEVRDPAKTIEVFADKRPIPVAAKVVWVQEAKSFGIALEVIRSLGEKELQLLNEPRVWQKLDTLHAELLAKNPAAAQYALASFMRHLQKAKWAPLKPEQLGERAPLEQVALLEWQRRSAQENYAKALQHPELSPRALELHLGRAPASTPP